MKKFLDREHAGKSLAHKFTSYMNRSDVIVLALPRGGVPVGFEIAVALQVPLDVFIVRKLGVPTQPELAMGAIAAGDVCILNDHIVKEFAITPATINYIKQQEQQELKRREIAYRGNKAFPILKEKIVILVDDGIATGATLRVAIAALRQLSPAQIIVAIPVAEKQSLAMIKQLVDEVVCLLIPENLAAVGAYYENFSQTTDNEVHTLLKLIPPYG